MANDNEVKIGLDIDEREALRALTKLIKKTDEVEKETKESFSKMDGFVSSFSGNLAANLVSGGISLAVGGMRRLSGALQDGVAAAQVQEDAVNLLNTSLRNAGEFSESASQGFQDFASAMEQTTKFGDEVILQQAAMARNFTGSNEEAMKLTEAAIELASATDMTLDSAVKNLGKTFAGLTGELGESLPALRNLTAEQLKAGGALQFVLDRFGGSAAADAQTFSGIIAQLSNEYGSFQERLGQSVTESDEAKQALLDLKNSFSAFGDIVAQRGPGIVSIISEFASTAIRGATGLAELLNTATETESLDVINQKIKETTDVINELQTKVDPNNVSVLGTLFGSFDQDQEKLGQAIDKLDELRAKRAQLTQDQPEVEQDPEVTREVKKTDKMLEIRRQREEQMRLLNEQSALQKEEMDIVNREAEFEQNERDFERLQQIETRKLEIRQKAEMEEVQNMAEGADKRLKVKELEVKQQDALNKLQTAQARAAAQREQQILQTRLQATAGFISAGLTLAKQGSREQKALQTVQALVSTYTAANQALASPPGPPFTIPLVASVIAGGLANVAKINSQSFATGGVIGGFTGATAGQDNTMANVRTGEMILNANQQKNLFEAIQQGFDGQEASRDNQPIVVNVDGREIARVVRDQKEQGFAV